MEEVKPYPVPWMFTATDNEHQYHLAVESYLAGVASRAGLTLDNCVRADIREGVYRIIVADIRQNALWRKDEH